MERWDSIGTGPETNWLPLHQGMLPVLFKNEAASSHLRGPARPTWKAHTARSSSVW